ncbi:putative quinol monooxygenase [Algibacter miyuki]|uniref:Quinol monooxygenase n=1 Tax=Algibacter miyuki TaxID=1306933 RepID=A0ABV5GVA1_9FLAO|nr:putative quinol monooxygenase [Algibacter miyuki]MDN3664892.1 putative quinol monooxygenase [Algibacter miyuki]
MEKTIIAQLSVKASEVTPFIALVNVMVAESLAEKGCSTYTLLQEVGTSNEFFIYEKYEDAQAVEDHNASEHFKTFINAVQPLLAKAPKIEVF